MIYLDNSSTTHYKPLCVKLACLSGLSKYSINPHRSGSSMSIRAEEKIYECRELLAEYVGTTAENVIFTSGCTMALNIALQGTVQKGGHIITTIYEHNSVLRTLEYLHSTHNITYTTLTPNKNGQINLKDITNSIKTNTYMVIVNHVSNVTGDTQNIEAIGKLCKKHKLIFLVDGAQSIGHEKIDMQKMNINMLTISGHKGLYAPQGIGALLLHDIKVNPLIYGGTGTYSDKIKQPSDIPDGIESGTPNIVGILGIYAGVKYITKHQDNINKKIDLLTEYTLNKLNNIKYLNLYSSYNHAGIISFTIKGLDSAELSNILDEEYHIITIPGLQCAPLIHKHLGTLKNGLTRISISHKNNKYQIDKLVNAIVDTITKTNKK